MCLSKIIALFKKKSTSAPGSGSAPKPPPKRLAIPRPPEAPDYSQTLENVNLDSALDEWEIKYNVPITYRDYWKTGIIVTLDANLPCPAMTFEKDGMRHLTIRPEWVNPGVIAHEQAHNSYALLTEQQKAEFSTIYTTLKTTDPLIVFLYSKNSYGLTNDIEGHAEVYRYIAEQMPEVLKKYYPRLFEEKTKQS